MVNAPWRDQVWLVSLDPTQGAGIQKTRHCLVVSPDEMNRHLQTVIIAPRSADTQQERPERDPKGAQWQTMSH